MRATKGNRTYTIDDAQKKHYQDSGFDILDDEGNTIGYGRGRTVPYDTYMKLVTAYEDLESRYAALVIAGAAVNEPPEAGEQEAEKQESEAGPPAAGKEKPAKKAGE